MGALLPGIIAVGKALTGEDLFQLPKGLLGDGAAQYRILINPGGNGNILCPLHASLDFHAGNAHFLQLPEIAHQAVVLEAQGIAILLPVIAIVQAAGLGALAPVSAAPSDHGGEIALPGIAHAQRPVDKYLHLNGAVLADIGDLVMAQLPGQYHPGDAHFRRTKYAVEIMHRHLGAGMNGHIRRQRPHQLTYPQILHQNRVYSSPGRLKDFPGNILQFPIQHQGIEGQVDLHPPYVAIAHPLVQLLQSEVFGVHTGIKAPAAQIYGIRSVLYRRHQRIAGACRG